jgi:hypothetical protein
MDPAGAKAFGTAYALRLIRAETDNWWSPPNIATVALVAFEVNPW